MEGNDDMGVPNKGRGKADKTAGEKASERRVAVARYVRTDSLKPYGRNPKTHDDYQVDALAAQIAAHGFDQPIVTDKDMVIIKGHGRLLAARKLGMPLVPVVVRTDMAPDEIMAARIADNKLAETGWEYDMLQAEMKELMAGGFNMGLTGFSDKEIEKIIGEAAEDAKEGAREIGEDELGLKHKCPKCGFEFGD
jgi:ParB-like chromosome segregation protein Spo0J